MTYAESCARWIEQRRDVKWRWSGTVDHSRQCEGNCQAHHGYVTRVHITHGLKDWGDFWYCNAAIDYDRMRGMEVEYAK